jgi:hypothetical protein
MKATWVSKLPDIAANQLPIASANAINKVTDRAASQTRVAVAGVMNIKKRSLLVYFIRAPREDRATKKKLKGRVMIGAPKTASDQTRGSILAQHAERGSKKPFKGRFVAMPSREISSKIGGKRIVKPGYGLQNFKPFSTPIDNGSNQTPSGARGSRIEGRKNTFVVFRKGTGMPILLQRYGRGLRQTRALWLWVRSTNLTKRLPFEDIVTKVWERRMQAELSAEMGKAVASARTVTSGGGVVSTPLR